ncbi:MAG TPA: helix-turn-helix domain-containing protein [Caulobacteraceae bacterium]|jgi:AraC-like DNA-binding protein
MSILEAGARGGTITLALLLTLLLLRDARRFAAARYGALFTVSLAAQQAALAKGVAIDPALWLAPFRVLAFANPALFLVVASALFDDDFAVGWPHVLAGVVLIVLGFWGVFGDHTAYDYFNITSALCLGLTLWHVGAGLRGDLVESRRRLRLVFVVAVALFGAFVSVLAVLTRGGETGPLFGYVVGLGALAMTFAFATALLALTPEGLFHRVGLQRPAEVRPAAPEPDDPRETALLAALRRELDHNRVYREEGLGIGQLAHRLGVPEYRLRRLINQRLGHRNFAAFLNGCRLDEAMAALGDPSQAEVPILTIALDAGFQSAATFNRAFKARTGLTPSEYRVRGHR